MSEKSGQDYEGRNQQKGDIGADCLSLIRYFLAESRYKVKLATIHGENLLLRFFQQISVPYLVFQDRKDPVHFLIEGWFTNYRMPLFSFRTVGR